MSATIPPSSDFFIRYLLGSEKNKLLTLSFINGVMQDSNFPPLVSLEIKNPFNLKNYLEDKESILDIKAEDDKGRKYNIEVQTSGDRHFKNRSLYYWARLYSDQLNEGQKYHELLPTICINILDFVLFDDINRIHTCFLLKDFKEPEFMLTDHIMIHFIELKKFSIKHSEIDSKLKHWLYFLTYGNKEEDPDMKFLIRDDEDIKKAYKEYKKFSSNERMKEIYEARFKRLTDEASALYAAEQKGRLEITMDYILEALNELAPLSTDLEQKIRKQKSLEVLQKWHKLAIKATSLEDFSRQIS